MESSADLRQASLLQAEEGEVSPEERDQILRHIERVVSQSRAPLTADAFALKPKKAGVFLPVLVNLAAAALIVAGIFALSLYFKLRQESITLRTAGFQSAEGTLLATLKRESEGKLREKDAEIALVRGRLQEVDRQATVLKNTMEERLKAREQELRKRLEAELASERERLKGLGTASGEIDTRVRALGRQKEAALTLEIAQYKKELETAQAAKERELSQAKQDLQDSLRAATQERSRLLAAASQREEELKTRYAREKQALEEKSSATEKELKRLTELQQKESLFADQVLGIYTLVMQSLQAADYAGAQKNLESLKALFSNPSLQGLPALQNRKQVELFLIDSLKELIAGKTGAEALVLTGEAAQAQAEAAAAAQAKVEAAATASADRQQREAALKKHLEAGNALLQKGEVEQGLAQYRQAILALLEATSELASGALQSLEKAYRLEREKQLAEKQSQIAEKDRQIQKLQREVRTRSGDIDTSLARSSKTIEELKARVDRLNSQVEALEKFKKEITSLRDRFSAYRSRLKSLNLEETKRQLSELLKNETAESVFPGISPTLEEIDRQHARSLEDRAVKQGREAALKEIMSFLDYLSQDSPQKKDLQSQLLAQARQDPLYAAVIREIQVLSAGAGLSSRSATSPYKLLGTVSQVLMGKVVIEPLLDMSVKAGSRVQIRRVTDLESELLIAAGVIQQTSGGKITAVLEAPLKAGQNPAVMDMVYVEARAGE